MLWCALHRRTLLAGLAAVAIGAAAAAGVGRSLVRAARHDRTRDTGQDGMAEALHTLTDETQQLARREVTTALRERWAKASLARLTANEMPPRAF